MDSDYDDPYPNDTLCSANPSIFAMTSAMTTGASWSKVRPARASRTHRRGPTVGVRVNFTLT
jgi:hypothetical protein